MRQIDRLLVTGGAGFIGSNFVHWMLGRHPQLRIVVLDKLTYAGNLANLADLEHDPRYEFVQGDIADPEAVEPVAARVDATVNFAAESHVDRSIEAGADFIRTDIVGTHVLLEAARRHRHQLFLQISTDEVYGHVESGSTAEDAPLAPRSPYAASKAGADLLVLAHATTYDLPVLITRSSNNYGPNQFPEKVVPLFVTNALDGEPLPLYGDGLQVRDWLFVRDNCEAIELVLFQGELGTIYNVGSGDQMTNLELTRAILAATGQPESLVRLVADRPGHDRRYAVDAGRVRSLGWAPRHSFAAGLAETIAWYQANQVWWRPLKSGEYLDYYRRQYADRLAGSRALE
ncbi:MAG TPA: dTDP-glucose 4,6-dehydratase [Candidatus Limnocylindria bacterium]